MSTSNETPESKDSPRNCWDYSEQEMREMSHAESAKLIGLRQQDNARKAREKAEAEEAEAEEAEKRQAKS